MKKTKINTYIILLDLIFLRFLLYFTNILHRSLLDSLGAYFLPLTWGELYSKWDTPLYKRKGKYTSGKPNNNPSHRVYYFYIFRIREARNFNISVSLY